MRIAADVNALKTRNVRCLQGAMMRKVWEDSRIRAIAQKAAASDDPRQVWLAASEDFDREARKATVDALSKKRETDRFFTEEHEREMRMFAEHCRERAQQAS